MEIVKGTFDDFDNIYNLLCELWEKYELDENVFKKMFVEDLESGKYFLLAKTEQDVVGLITMDIRNGYEYGGKTGMIMEFVIGENFRGKGIGKYLMNSVLDLAKEQGCKFIELVCANHRVEAHAVYKKVGFKNTALYFNKEI
jgi:PhnO protein